MDSPVVLGKGSQFSLPEPDHPVPVKTFYQGEPVALGITQILIGIIGIVFGILLNFIDIDDSTYFLLIKIPYWGGILHIISGSLTVAAARNPKIPLVINLWETREGHGFKSLLSEELVKGMLAMNAISAITAGLGIVFLSFSVSPLLPFDFGYNCNYHRYDTKERCDEIQNIGKGILIFLIVLAILEFCISISLASFGCKVLCRDPFTETVRLQKEEGCGCLSECDTFQCRTTPTLRLQTASNSPLNSFSFIAALPECICLLQMEALNHCWICWPKGAALLAKLSMDSSLILGPGSLSPTTQTDLPVPLKKFYQGEPLALGYIISGSLAVAAARNPKIPLVKGTLAMNVISAITAGICIIFLGLAITFFRYHFMYLCYRFGNESEEKSCHDETIHIIEGILAVLIVFTVLEFCITISLASFGCKMLCRNTFTETVVVIYQNETPANAEHPPIDFKQPEFP
ncbi:Membrane-spanning 4-domains subfamily A member 4A [Ophiophagus hannah]|uniref:Membrane-spanning 4-domains subfamily A member 4A n=1 Tax=Ophiophagus hannah TaxID=8665 RepID=V8NQH7_OPHHA|nr:Membrane-spanning 4-domains subfamily A member 4A [Ophiophagus hannah]